MQEHNGVEDRNQADRCCRSKEECLQHQQLQGGVMDIPDGHAHTKISVRATRNSNRLHELFKEKRKKNMLKWMLLYLLHLPLFLTP